MEFYKRDEYKEKCGIYCIVNHLTGDAYVGQTGQKFLKRFLHHDWKLRNGSHDNQHLQNAWNLYGEQYFSFIPVKVMNITQEAKDSLDELEIEYINIMREMNHCYNIIDGGNSSRKGIPLTEEHKKGIGEKNKIHMTGRKHSEETKHRMSESRKGKRVNFNYYKLKENQIIKIKQLLISGMKPSLVAKQINVDYKLVNGILSNDTWNNIKVDGWEEFQKTRKRPNRLSIDTYEVIYNLYLNGYSKYELAEKYNKNIKTIEYIIRKQRKLHDNPVPSL